MEGAYQELRIFLSSPGDVADERKIAKSIIDSVGRTCKEPLRLHFEPVLWEDMTPMGATEESIQAQINEKIRDCHVFVLILNKRFGSAEPGFKKSNTEREIDISLALKKENKKIKFLAYFHKLDENNDQGEQEKKVRDLRKSLADKGILYSEYESLADFQTQFTHHLYDTALKFRHSTFKMNALSYFWKLGTPERYTNRQIAVLYPTMSFSHMKPVNSSDFWLTRIVPTVLYEDIKAVDKVEKTLRMLGVRDAGFYTIDNPPSEINFMNRVWVCQSRNKLGLKYHEKHKDKARFFFTHAKGSKEAKLYWRYNTEVDDYIEIKSPLNKYLKEQRGDMKVNGPWRKEFGMIVAKDYGILARIKNSDYDVPMREGFLYDYFIAGIRGLGTWGAAHFIDRNYHVFKSLPDDEDIQILLEVTYRNNRVFDVKDVSDEPEHYFRSQNNLKTIRKVIEEESPYEANN